MPLTTKEVGVSSFTEEISSLDRRSTYVENRAYANVLENNFTTPYTLNNKSSIINVPAGYSDSVLASLRPIKTFGSNLIDYDNLTYGSGGWSLVNNKWVFDDVTSGYLVIDSIDVEVGQKYQVTVNISISSGNANFRITSGNGQTLLFNYTDFADGETTFETTVTGVDGTLQRLFAVTSLTDNPFTLNSISVKKITEADFDFSRGSSATRVNEKGLIEDVQILSGELVQNGDFEQIGSELVTNGDFSVNGVLNTSSYTLGWYSPDSNINITNNELVITNDASIGGRAYPTNGVNNINVVVSGQFYKLIYTIAENNDNAAMVYYTGGAYVSAPNTVGTHIIYYKAAGTIFILKNNTPNTTVKIDNVSIKEVGQNWTFGTGWSMGDGEAIHAQSGGAGRLYQSYTNFVIGKTYKLTAKIDTTGDLTLSNTALTFRNSTNTADLAVLSSGGGDILPNQINNVELIWTANTTSALIHAYSADDVVFDDIKMIEITDDTDIPRIDYTTGFGSWLLEPQRTNLITYSEDFSDSSWDKEGGAIIQSNVDISPSGSINASYLKAPVTTNNTVRVSYTFSCTSSQTYVGSVFVKKQNVDFIRMLSTGATSSTLQAFYNVSNGTLGTSGTPSKATIEDYGNGWYRLNLIIDAVNTSSGATFRVQLAKTDGAVINDFDGTEKNLIWGAQLEQGSYPTSYIVSNSGSATTRSAETANNSGNTDLINSTEGVLYAEISALADDQSYRYITLSDGTNSNYVVIRYYNIANKISAFIENTSGVQGSTSHSFSPSETITDFHKVAFKWKANDFALWINGTEVSTQSSGTTFSANVLNKLQFNEGDGSGNDFYGNVKCVAVFKEALTDEELAQITSVTQQEVFYAMRDRMNMKNYDYYEFDDYTTRLKKLF